VEADGMAMVSSAVSVLVVDGLWLFREALAELLRAQSWTAEVRTAACAWSAAATAGDFAPDVTLVSIASPDVPTIMAAMRAAAPTTRLVVLAVTEDEDAIVRCAEEGAAGFVTRDGTIEDLGKAVACAVRGEALCSPWVAGVLARRVGLLAARQVRPREVGHLTPREREVLVLIEQGMTNKEIARQLGIELRTVKNHVHNLLEKLRVGRRGEAAARLRMARVPAFELLRGDPERAAVR
jgi:DNA-binding NarL/FixJ family response regulator